MGEATDITCPNCKSGIMVDHAGWDYSMYLTEFRCGKCYSVFDVEVEAVPVYHVVRGTLKVAEAEDRRAGGEG